MVKTTIAYGLMIYGGKAETNLGSDPANSEETMKFLQN